MTPHSSAIRSTGTYDGTGSNPPASSPNGNTFNSNSTAAVDISAAGAVIRIGQRVAVVTASTAGIGLAVAHTLAARGYHVVVSSRDIGRVSATVGLLRSRFGSAAASGLSCHVGRAADRLALVTHARELARRSDGDGIPVIQALVLNAAASTAYGPLLDTTEKQWDKMFDTNVKATFLLMKAFDGMLRRGSAVVVTSSIAGYVALPGLGAYSVSKTALLGLVKVLSVELGGREVRVNGVAPGIIKTRFSQRLWEGENSLAEQTTSGRHDGAAKQFHVPMKRIGEPQDVAGMVAFLLSDEATYISGETIVISGGATSKL